MAKQDEELLSLGHNGSVNKQEKDKVNYLKPAKTDPAIPPILNADIFVTDKKIEITINSILNLQLKREEYIGLQSWFEGRESKVYKIELYTKTRDILLEYDKDFKWKKILELLRTIKF